MEADKGGNSNVAILNPDFNNGQGIGSWLKFEKENLPYLVQWKQIGEGEYVYRIEPVNSIGNRKEIRTNGTLKFIVSVNLKLSRILFENCTTPK